ncbi:DUF397 domain-containing protein [Streptomyces sp. NPDC050439]|uniref:DUF397 domain-containing protein n=1 Tax=unclassified Streptomyces TaxID=2593676 RepID=UPI003413C5F8
MSELIWFKRSYSGGSGDDCVEVALAWRKCTYSSGGSGDCVEVATSPATTIHIRDSKNPEGPQLALHSNPGRRFLTYATRP